MKKGLLFCCSILLLALLTACGGRAGNDAAMAESASAPAAAAPTPAEEAEWTDDAWDYGAEMMGETGADLGASIPIDHLIYRAHTEVQTREFDQAVEQIHTLLADHRGFIEQVSITGRDYHAEQQDLFARRTAEFTLRVPAAGHDAMLRALDDLGATTYLFMEAENVSAQYADITSRLNALRVQEERIMTLFEGADNMADILELERRLSDLILDIERLTSNRLHLDQQIAFSTVYLRLVEVHAFTPLADPTFGQQMDNVFALQLGGMAQFFRDIVLTAIMLLPWLVPAAIAALPVFLLLRRSWRRKKKRKSEEDESS